MTKFNPENKEILTYGECLDPVMQITDKEDADQYFASYLEYTKNNFDDASGKYTPEEVCKINIGYWAGYYDNEVRKRVESLFICAHPIFGTISEMGVPTSEEASECRLQNKPLNDIRQ